MKSILILLLILSLQANGETDGRSHVFSGAVAGKVHAILDAVYRMDYDRSDQLAKELIKERPDYPAGYVYLARSYWSRELNNTRLLSVETFAAEQFFSRPPIKVSDESEARFEKAAEEAIEKAKTWNRANPRDVGGAYLLGAAYQMKASYEFSIHRAWWKSAKLGNNALVIHKQIMEADPSFYDAYLSVGALHYVVGSLPWALRPIAWLMQFKGSRAEGLKELEIAAERGDLSADDAKALLAVLYTRDRQFSKATAKLKQLEAKYPENYVIPQDLAAVALLDGRPAEALATYRRVLGANPRGLERPPLLMRMGVAAREAKDLSGSSRHFEEALAAKNLDANLQSAIHLEFGKTLDLAGKRKEAVAQYRLVSGGPEISDLREEARRFISRPYKQGS